MEDNFCPECAKQNKQTEIFLYQFQKNEYIMVCSDYKCTFRKNCVGIPKTSDDLRIPPLEPKRLTREEIQFCPTCAKKKKRNLLSASQLNNNEYALTCNDANCFFIKTGVGIVPLGKEELIACGYPEELLLHMDVYEDDLHKITRLCIYQYLEKRTRDSSRNIDRDLLEINDEIEVLRFVHGINPKDTTVNANIFEKPSFRKLQKELAKGIAELSSDYKEKVISAFSKIENYKFPESLIVSIKNSPAPTEVPKDDFASLNAYIQASASSGKHKVAMADELQQLIDSYDENKLPLIDDEGEQGRQIADLEQELGIEELLKKYNIPSKNSNVVEIPVTDNVDEFMRHVKQVEQELGIDKLLKKINLPSKNSNVVEIPVTDNVDEFMRHVKQVEQELGIDKLLKKINLPSIDSNVEEIPVTDNVDDFMRHVKQVEQELGIDKLLKKIKPPSIDSNSDENPEIDNVDEFMRHVKQMEQGLEIEELLKKCNLPIDSNSVENPKIGNVD